MESDDVLIGSIVKPHGVEGAFLVEPLTDYPEVRFESGNSITIRSDQGKESMTVENSTEHQGRWLVHCREISDLDRAEKLRGAEIVISEDEVIGGEGELYDFDLIGMDVLDEENHEYGTVEAVSVKGNRPVLKINSDEFGTIEFPAHDDFVIDHSRHDGWIQLKFPSGWENLIVES